MDPTLDALIQKFLAIEEISPRSRTVDQDRSLEFVHIELALEIGETPPGAGRRPVRWVERVRGIHSAIRQNSLFPRENNRVARGGINTRQQSDADWIRTQRRPVNRTALCQYQVGRLALLPGFSWAPHDDAWAQQLDNYRTFTDTYRRLPAARSTSDTERNLAHWADKQRAARRAGRLSATREPRLDELIIWRW